MSKHSTQLPIVTMCFFSECLCRQELNMAVVLGKGLWQKADKTL